jgi:hypothetical protein
MHSDLAAAAPHTSDSYVKALDEIEENHPKVDPFRDIPSAVDRGVYLGEKPPPLEIQSFESFAEKDAALAKILRDSSESVKRILATHTKRMDAGDSSELLDAFAEFDTTVKEVRTALTIRDLLAADLSSAHRSIDILNGSAHPTGSTSPVTNEFLKHIKREEERIKARRANGPASCVGQNDAERLNKFFNERNMFDNGDSDDVQESALTCYLNGLEAKGGAYMWLAAKCTKIKKTTLFKIVIITVICLAGIADGLATYDAIGSNEGFQYFQTSLLFVFILELLVKVISTGYHPWRYFSGYKPDPKPDYSAAEEGSWNCFDCVIVCVGVAELTGAGQGLSFLRLLRLLRVLRLLKFWLELQMIISGLIGGIKASVAIVALICFVLFLYGTLGTTMFGKNDPVHFGNLFKSMMTLYLVSNYEWLDLLYTNMFSCANYPAGIYEDAVEYAEEAKCVAAFMSANVTERVSTSNVTFLGLDDVCSSHMVVEAMSDEAMYEFNAKVVCAYPMEQRELAAIYFISYIILMSMVLMTLFMGAVSMSMTAKMLVIKEQAAERKREQVNEHTERTLREFDGKKKHQKSRWESSCISYFVRPEQIKDQFAPEFDGRPYHRTLHKLTNCPEGRAGLACFGATERDHLYGSALASEIIAEVMVDAAKILAKEGSKVSRRMSTDGSMRFLTQTPTDQLSSDHSSMDPRMLLECAIHWYADLALKMHALAKTKVFNWTITSAILLAAGMNAYTAATLVNGLSPTGQPSEETLVWIVMEWTIQGAFTVEFLVQLLSEGFCPYMYFMDGWKNFDFVILVLGYLPYGGNTASGLRVLRVIKLLKQMEGWPSVHVVICAFTAGIAAFRYIGMLWFLLIYVYAIAGTQIFGENDPRHFGVSSLYVQ